MVFSTDSRPVKRRKTNVDRQFERMLEKQVPFISACVTST